MSSKNKNNIIILFLSIIAVIAIFSGIYFFVQYQNIKNQKQENPEEVEIRNLINTISDFYNLPQNETPTLATVTDINLLKNQSFFKNAKNGDKVLLYFNAKKAILFRPSLNKIIDVAPIDYSNLISPTPSPSPTPTPVPTLANAKIVLYNGSTTPGITQPVETLIKNTYSNFTISSKTNAKKKNYTQTLVIDLNGNYSNEVNILANLLNNAKVDSMPSGENKPNADILIIVAK